ncbi:MAG: D-2-hydroxyacid dehydrogenase [Lachnospiraceae bacterium]|nr:D-2-hydroxyacid dehydrogenase [Lachnospiraceae bacterium]
MKIVMLERHSVGTDVDVSCMNELGDFTAYDNTVTPEEVMERIGDAEAVIANKAPLNADTLKNAAKLKFIGELATGYDNIDIEYCKEKGIRVANVRDYSTAMVAQHTFTLALAVSQKLVHYDSYVKSGQYAAQQRFSNFDIPFYELDKKTWGVVGLGNIGSKVARIADAFGCRVITHSITGSRHDDSPYEQVDKETLLRESDYISLHCPLSDLSRGFIDAGALAAMKPTAILINVARGPVVDSAALADALEKGIIAGAGLDVLEKEPIAANDPLGRIKDSNRLIITPHLAWASVEARTRCVEGVYLNLKAFMNGEVRNAVC